MDSERALLLFRCSPWRVRIAMLGTGAFRWLSSAGRLFLPDRDMAGPILFGSVAASIFFSMFAFSGQGMAFWSPGQPPLPRAALLRETQTALAMAAGGSAAGFAISMAILFAIRLRLLAKAAPPRPARGPAPSGLLGHASSSWRALLLSTLLRAMPDEEEFARWEMLSIGSSPAEPPSKKPRRRL